MMIIVNLLFISGIYLLVDKIGWDFKILIKDAWGITMLIGIVASIFLYYEGAGVTRKVMAEFLSATSEESISQLEKRFHKAALIEFVLVIIAMLCMVYAPLV